MGSCIAPGNVSSAPLPHNRYPDRDRVFWIDQPDRGWQQFLSLQQRVWPRFEICRCGRCDGRIWRLGTNRRGVDDNRL
jgi:hypothetical protein